MGLNEREQNRQGIVAKMVSRNNTNDQLSQRSYYLTDELIKALALESALTGKDKSEIVREALEHRLAERMKEYKNK